MSLDLIYFKAHLRGFDGGYKLDIERHKKCFFFGSFLQGKGRRTRDREIGMETP